MSNKLKIDCHFLLGLLLTISFILLAYISLGIFHDYPFCMDEHSYSFQAHLFAKGHLYQKVLVNERSLLDLHMVIKDENIFSKYPPGFPLFLAIGVFLKIPGLINPFLSIITLFFIYKIAITFVRPAIALSTVLFVATNSYFIGYGASYFAQPMLLSLVTMGLYLYRRYELDAQSVTAMLLGLVLGLGVLTRPVDALCLFLVTASGIIFILIRTKKWIDFAYLIIFPIVCVLILGAYFFVLTKEFGICAPVVWKTDCALLHFSTGGFWQNALLLKNNYCTILRKITMRCVSHEFILKIGYPFLILALGGLFRKKSNHFQWRCLGCLLIFIILYGFQPYNEWSQYGARYYYPAFSAVAILLALGLGALDKFLPRYLLYIIIAACSIYQLMNARHDLVSYSKRFKFVEAVNNDIHQHCPENSIVILKRPLQWKAPEFVKWDDFHKNFMPRESRFFVWTRKDADMLIKSHPQHVACEYDFSNQQLP